MKKKILHYGLSCYKGGIETYLMKISRNINREDVEFLFVDEWEGQAYFRHELEQMGFKFVDIISRRKSFVKNRRQWDELLMREKPDVLHCHLNTLSYIYPIVAAKKYGIKVIVHSRSAGDMGALRSRLLHYVNYRKIEKLDIIRVAVSQEAGKWLFRNLDYIVINNGIDECVYKFSMENRNKIREELDIECKTVIGNVASLSKPKNIDFLLDIFCEFHKYNKNSVLVVVGEGILKSYLREYAKSLNIEQAVIFTGKKDNVEEMLSAMDLFVMTSLYEGFPNALLEAQCSGLRCVVSDKVTREANVGLCTYISLNEAPKKWIEVMMKSLLSCEERGTAYLCIKEKGFSVGEEVKKLMELYK